MQQLFSVLFIFISFLITVFVRFFVRFSIYNLYVRNISIGFLLFSQFIVVASALLRHNKSAFPKHLRPFRSSSIFSESVALSPELLYTDLVSLQTQPGGLHT